MGPPTTLTPAPTVAVAAAAVAHPTPSSGTAGFFQISPEVQNTFEEDLAFRRLFKFYLPQNVQATISPDLLRFGSLVLESRVMKLIADAERNPPYVQPLDTWGRRVDKLITSEGWRALQDLGIAEGIVAIPYENLHGQYSRLYQFLKYHIWAPSSALVTCPSAMADGAARLLSTHLSKNELLGQEREVFGTAYKHLTSRNPREAWTSGQWMTERPGGSDVRNTETQARFAPHFEPTSSTQDVDGFPLGPWSISGFKWFSSATDSQMTIMLAKMPSGSLSAFFAPMRRRIPGRATAASGPVSDDNTELNGISIQRLKSKLGTRPVPTAELILENTRAYLIGKEGQGVKEISTILNITRMHTSVAAIGNWGRGLSIARAFARVRESSGKLLIDIPAHVRTMAEQHVEYRAMLHLSLFSTALLGIAESLPSAVYAPEHLSLNPLTAPHILRLMTPICKAMVARSSIAGLRECMEFLGGVGYLENEDQSFNIARLFRDTNVNSIWEGTTNVLGDDVVRVLKGKGSAAVVEAFTAWVEATSRKWQSSSTGTGTGTGSGSGSGNENRNGGGGGGPSTHGGSSRSSSSSSVWKQRAAILRAEWSNLRAEVTDQQRSVDELKFRGRELLFRLSWLVCALLLGEDARTDGDLVAEEICARWFEKKQLRVGADDNGSGSSGVVGRSSSSSSSGNNVTHQNQEGGDYSSSNRNSSSSSSSQRASQEWSEIAWWDKRIVFGEEEFPRSKL